MKEHLTVDSVMTADGEVVPLGPVDKEGRKVSLSTATLFADSGMECTVKRRAIRWVPGQHEYRSSR